MSNVFPIGAVIAFAGTSAGGLGPSWLVCDGRSMPIDEATEPLFRVIGTANGGDGSTGFNLPDYRGRFLRGVDHGAGRDPDASARLAPGADGSGNEGDRVGSIQSDATAAPVAGFSTMLPHLPSDEGRRLAATAVGYNIARFNGDTNTIDTCQTGGDAESRPANLYLQYYIFAG